jgi:hypothetical protein
LDARDGRERSVVGTNDLDRPIGLRNELKRPAVAGRALVELLFATAPDSGRCDLRRGLAGPLWEPKDVSENRCRALSKAIDKHAHGRNLRKAEPLRAEGPSLD